MTRPAPDPIPSPWWSASPVLLLAACDGPQSTLAPNGPAAEAVARLWWVLFAVATLVSVAVCVVLAVALFRRREVRGVRPPLPLAQGAQRKKEEREEQGEPPTEDEERREDPDSPVNVQLYTAEQDRRVIRWVVGAGVGATGVILVAMLLLTLSTQARIHDRGTLPDLTIEVTGWQWWWEVHYLDAEGRSLFETANEIHIPVGKRVRVRLRAADVIHSFWVPQLAGKLDMIPGRTNVLHIQADRPGVYRGQCAEYCAGPHALMAMLVVAEPEAEFRAWAARQSLPEPPPADPLAAAGREVFLRSGCIDCHAIRGTPAAGVVGPDLTHVAGRRTLAAVTIPNTKGHLGGWITSPQQIKPGSKMPAVPLEPAALHALLQYLQSLE